MVALNHKLLNFQGQIQNGAKNIFNKFNTQENRSWLQQLWDNVVNFSVIFA